MNFQLGPGWDDVHFIVMSGWGCRYQFDEQCLRLRKTCKPGIPGCVLYGKVRFISDVECDARPKNDAKSPPIKRRKQRGSSPSARKKSPARRSRSAGGLR